MTGRRALLCALPLALIPLLSSCSSKPKVTGPAPEQFRAQFTTTKGNFVVLVHRDWAPLGADRFYELMKMHFFDHNYFFRMLPGFIVQWGINGDPKVAKDWSVLSIKDDPFKMSNRRGTVTFATAGANSRTTQVFVNLNDNTGLDGQGFTPFGEISEGMNVIESLYGGYGEGAPRGQGPDQQAITDRGNDYLEEHFPRLDYIKKTSILEP
ncbi:MAG TPA: peptidylprolyl isomerase [Bryobacteraceae bacterium]|jgi:peptidyl-prolyl cis-trans isomerase A (cyclophilin A)|nr:peptidylprolyl isomerase [Bryobacteraceae bacterium]